MPTRPLIVPARLDRRLRQVATARGETPKALLRTILKLTLPALAGERPSRRWWLTSMHLAGEDVARVGLGKVLSEAPRWTAEPAGCVKDRAALCLLRRDDEVLLVVEFLPHCRRLWLHGALGERQSERTLILHPAEAWVDLSATGWRRMLAEADRLADELQDAGRPRAGSRGP